MKKLIKFIIGLLLFIIAWGLFFPLSMINAVIVIIKYKNLNYFKNSAVNFDKFGNRELRTLFNLVFKKKRGYEFGNMEETISSALGKNQRNNTLSTAGKVLVRVLDTIDKNHCEKSIKEIEN